MSPSLFLALAYFATGWLGTMLPAYGTHITLVWLPTGIAVAALLRWGNGCWPGISLGAFAVSMAVGTHGFAVLAIAVGNTLGPLLAAMMLRRFGFHPVLDRARDILLLAGAAVLGMAVTSSVGVAALAMSGVPLSGKFGLVWLIWWVGDVLGVITAAPLVLTFTGVELGAILRRRLELLIWIGSTMLMTWGVFIANAGAPGDALALAFLPLPLVAWAALRFGAVGTSVGLIILSVGAAYGTATLRGPFYRAEPFHEVTLLWLYMVTSAVLGWLISALHTAREQASGTQRLFEQALTDVSLGVLLAGLDRRITYANQGFTRLTGYTEAEVVGKSCAFLQGSETDLETVGRLKTALDGEGFFDGEILNYRKDGATFWNGLLISPVRDESGVKTGFLSIQRDITKRKRVEVALHESEEHLRTMVELEPECVTLVSREGKLLEINPAGLAMIEADSVEAVRGRPLSEVFRPEDCAAFSELHQRALQGATGRCECGIVGRKGTRRWVERHAVPYRNAQREIVGVLEITRDISSRRAAAAEQESSLSTLQLFINSIPAYVSFVDADERYRLVNHRYEDYFGQPAERLVGQRVREIQPPAAYAEMEPYIRTALRGQPVHYQLHPTGPDGRSYWFDVQYVPRRGEDGAVSGFFVLVFDITERKSAEEALRDSEERLRLAMSAAHQGLYDLNTQTGECIVSPEYALMLGYDPAEFRETNAAWRERMHPDERGNAYQAYADYLAGRIEEYRVEFRQRTRDGGWKWVLSIGSIVERSDDGQPLRMLGTHTDITDRKLAEERVRDSEVRYRKLFEANPHPMWLHDLETLRFLAVNDAAVAHYGYSEEEFLAMTTAEIRPADEVPRLLAAIDRVKEGHEYHGPFRHRKRDGSIIDVEVNAHVLELDGKRAAVVLAHDVTERFRAEARSAGERAVLELLSSGAPLGEVLDRLARSYEEIFPGMLCTVLLLDEEGKRLRHGAAPSIPEAFRRAVDGGEIGPNVGSCGTAAYTRQTTVVTDIATNPLWKDYRELALSHGLRACWSVPVISSQGRVLGTLALYYHEPAKPLPDQVSAIERGAHIASLAIERHQLLRSLQESQVRLETLVRNLPGMAYRCRNDPEWTMTYVSDGCEAITGYRREELEGNRVVSFGHLIHPEDRERIWTTTQADIAARRSGYLEYRIVRKDGRIRWISDRDTAVYGAASELLFLDGFIQDITDVREAKAEREQLDRKMQETQKLESLGVLAGGIAHDFNNLLTAILGNASIAQLELPPGSSVLDCLEHITEASLRAADLCKQMLAYSGRGRFVVQTLDLGELVEQTAQMLQISISKKAVLRYRLEKGLPAIEVDATQIRQVIMNLVINASEAIGDESGVISISTGLTQVDRDYLRGTLMDPDLPEGDYVFLEVSDSGCGMSIETQARIFDPFFTTKFTGRGLGLAAVLGIVRGHKGAMKVYSEVDRGTTFKLLFPMAAGASETSKEPAVPVAQWHGEGSVLVVDDEETMRSTIARMMRLIGLDPVLAADGREAVEVFRASPGRFVFVLLDLTMPHMDGEQTFAELRRLRPEVRVVLMSGFNAQEALVRFSGKGLANFLQKPFTIESLRTVVKSVLS